ncbi:MAG: cupin domain-containing protein [Acidobacteria bacterium]|nr:cupin domain-containing protein [Acidobacteriota bacterium]
MNLSHAWTWTGRAVAVALLTTSASGQYKQPVPEGFVRLDADEIKAGPIYGDPRAAGIYVTRNRFAPGQGSHPHYHDKARYITVIKGTWWVSLGAESDTYNPEKMTAVKPGSFIYEPAFGHHYDMAKDEEVVVQIMGEGPVTSTQLDAKKP